MPADAPVTTASFSVIQTPLSRVGHRSARVTSLEGLPKGEGDYEQMAENRNIADHLMVVFQGTQAIAIRFAALLSQGMNAFRIPRHQPHRQEYPKEKKQFEL